MTTQTARLRISRTRYGGFLSTAFPIVCQMLHLIVINAWLTAAPCTQHIHRSLSAKLWSRTPGQRWSRKLPLGCLITNLYNLLLLLLRRCFCFRCHCHPCSCRLHLPCLQRMMWPWSNIRRLHLRQVPEQTSSKTRNYVQHSSLLDDAPNVAGVTLPIAKRRYAHCQIFPAPSCVPIWYTHRVVMTGGAHLHTPLNRSASGMTTMAAC